DKSGSYWFHFPQEEKVKKLVRWNPDSRNVSSYPYTGPPHSSTFMFEDNNQQIWFSTNNNQLQCLNPETGIYSKYSVSDWMNLGNQPVTLNCMLQDANRRFWVGTSHGLLSFEMKDGSPDGIQWYKNESGKPSSLNNDYILHILQDPKDGNCLWIGTKGGGLNKLDILSQTFSAIRQRDGLPNDVIY